MNKIRDRTGRPATFRDTRRRSDHPGLAAALRRDAEALALARCRTCRRGHALRRYGGRRVGAVRGPVALRHAFPAASPPVLHCCVQTPGPSLYFTSQHCSLSRLGHSPRQKPILMDLRAAHRRQRPVAFGDHPEVTCRHLRGISAARIATQPPW